MQNEEDIYTRHQVMTTRLHETRSTDWKQNHFHCLVRREQELRPKIHSFFMSMKQQSFISCKNFVLLLARRYSQSLVLSAHTPTPPHSLFTRLCD